MNIMDVIDPTMSEKEREAVAALAEIGHGAPHRTVRDILDHPRFKRPVLDGLRDEAIKHGNSPPYARAIKAIEAL